MTYEDRAQLLDPQFSKPESGIVHVSVLTPMPNAKAEMIAWWFGTYMQTTEHYVWWHPRDHVSMEWADETLREDGRVRSIRLAWQPRARRVRHPVGM